MNTNAGIHYILELKDCAPELLDNETFVRDAIAEAASAAHATLLTLSSHKFEPQGVTALGLLAESHISIHTWPEAGYAAVDIFTCGPDCKPQLAGEYLAKALKAEAHDVIIVPRGKGLAHLVNYEDPDNRRPNSCPAHG